MVRIPLACALLLSILPSLAAAQQAPAAEARRPDGPPPQSGWSLGVATIRSDGVMLGEGARSFVVPAIGYEGERVFFRGITGGVHLFERGGVQLDATLSARLDGWEARDLDAAALAARGIDRARLRDRDTGVDAGLGVVWQGRRGVFGASVKADVSGASEGVEALVEYGLPLRAGGGLLTPTAQLAWWSGDLTGYYYGTLPQEEAEGVPSYRPGAALVPGVGVRWLRPFAQRWVLVAGVQHSRLDDAISDSPLVDDDATGITSLYIGISRRFASR